MSQLAPQRRQWKATVFDGIAFIPTGRNHETMVDAADLPLVEGRTWSSVRPNGKLYAAASAHRDGTPLVYMHRLIMGFGPGDPHVDHVNGDGLDNRRSNLRPATHAQNMANQGPRGGSSQYKGVSWSKRERMWRVYVKVAGRQIGGGYFTDERAAALAHDRLATEHFGEFAHLNFPGVDE